MPYLVMGVCGTGKTTTGKALAQLLGAERFLDADDYHPPANITKMKSGVPLTDADRQPWLERLAAELRSVDNTVLACSALKAKYRTILTSDLGPEQSLTVIFLDPSRSLIEEWMAARDHFMPPSLLQSQFDALERPVNDEPSLGLVVVVQDDVYVTTTSPINIAEFVHERICLAAGKGVPLRSCSGVSFGSLWQSISASVWCAPALMELGCVCVSFCTPAVIRSPKVR